MAWLALLALAACISALGDDAVNAAAGEAWLCEDALDTDAACTQAFPREAGDELSALQVKLDIETGSQRTATAPAPAPAHKADKAGKAAVSSPAVHATRTGDSHSAPAQPTAHSALAQSTAHAGKVQASAHAAKAPASGKAGTAGAAGGAEGMHHQLAALSQLAVGAASSSAGSYVIIGLLIVVAVVGIVFVARDALPQQSQMGKAARRPDAAQGSAQERTRAPPAMLSRPTLPGADRGRPSIQRQRPSMVTTAGLRQASQSMLPDRGSLPARASSPAPSPRRIANMPTTNQAGRKLLLADPSIWNQFEAFFLIAADRLPAEVGTVGDFEILRGVSHEPSFYASVACAPPTGKRVFALAAAGRPSALSSCAPSPGACPMVGGQAMEPCSELQIRNQDNIIWGTLTPRGADRYSVHRGKEQVLTLVGDQDSGRLVVYLEDEPVAHAARSQGSEYLEVGVKPTIDPILMLTCILAVVIFNPEEVASQPPSMVRVPGR